MTYIVSSTSWMWLAAGNSTDSVFLSTRPKCPPPTFGDGVTRYTIKKLSTISSAFHNKVSSSKNNHHIISAEQI
ncbi:hypothetical protein M8J77_008847 [Diaphorina citri]|nr:hypothetical protein M8J77_008847 [Diaphorina citri]